VLVVTQSKRNETTNRKTRLSTQRIEPPAVFNRKSDHVCFSSQVFDFVARDNPICKQMTLAGYRELFGGSAEEGDFYLRAFNYLFVMRKSGDSKC